MNEIDDLPLVEVIEVNFAEVLKNIERLKVVGQDESITRNDELNAALATLPIIQTFVNRLTNWGGEISELPSIDGVLEKVDLFNDVLKTLLAEVPAY